MAQVMAKGYGNNQSKMNAARPTILEEVGAKADKEKEHGLKRTRDEQKDKDDEDFDPHRGTARRRPYARGDARGLDQVSADKGRIAALLALRLAKSTSSSQGSRLKWWARRAAARQLEPYPRTPAKLVLMTALLRAGRYRSAEHYVSDARGEHVRRGHPWTDLLDHERRLAIRGATRGLGPARQAAPFDLDAIADIKGDVFTELPADSPALPIDAVIVASWWLLREIELATLRLDQVSFIQVPGSVCGDAAINLPISKADPRALGYIRTLSCTCASGSSARSARPSGRTSLCPVFALRALVDFAAGPGVVRSDGLSGQKSGPRSNSGVDGRKATRTVLCTAHGKPCTKYAVAAAFRAVARRARQPSWKRITAHSGRVTGAQRMASAGISEWRIRVFGRWGSRAVRRYIRDADAATAAKGVSQDVSSNCLRDEIARQVAADRSCAKGADRARIRRVVLEVLAGQPAFAKPGAEEIAPAIVQPLVTSALRTAPGPAGEFGGRFVRGRRGKVVHTIRDAATTWCGWHWAAPAAGSEFAASVRGHLGCLQCARVKPCQA